MKIRWADGAVYVGKNAEEVVRDMKLSALFLPVPLPSVGRYCRQVRNRIAQIDDVLVRVDTPEHFLADLAEANIIVVEES